MEIPEFQNLTIENECEVEENYELALTASDLFVGASLAGSPPLPDALLSALGIFPTWDEVKTDPLHYSDSYIKSATTIWKEKKKINGK